MLATAVDGGDEGGGGSGYTPQTLKARSSQTRFTAAQGGGERLDRGSSEPGQSGIGELRGMEPREGAARSKEVRV